MNQYFSKSRVAGRIAAGGSLLVGTAGVGMFLAPHAGATGSTFTVTNTNDSGAGSLRQALLDADANPGADTVVFDAAVTGTITLTTGKLNVADSVTVTGPGSANLTVSAATDQIFYLYNAGVSRDVSISGLTLTGGAIAVNAWTTNLVLDDVVASGSTTFSLINSVSNYSELAQSLTIRNSVVTGANIYGDGGGVGVFSGFGQHAVSIESTQITNNTAYRTGGLRVENASSVVVSNSLIKGNSSTYGRGGGAYFGSEVGDVQIVSTTVDSNSSHCHGGGLYLMNATVEILNSTISNNSAPCTGGGVLFDDSRTVASISNTTITGNTARGGGGVHMEAMTSLKINQSTITNNTSTDTGYDGGGIRLYSQGSSYPMTLTLSGTIVSGNTSANPANADIDVMDGGATAVDSDHSLLGDGTVDSVVTLVGSGNLRSNTPGLGALADNGGLTKTMALLTGSPAIDAGPNPVATFTGNGFDQRATPYLRVYGGQVDIGAFEWQPTTTPSTTTSIEPSSDPVAPAFTG